MANQYVNQVGLADGTILLDVSSDTAARTDVLSGKYFHLATGERTTGTCTYDSNTTDANALATEILSGKTAYVNKVKITGEMTNNGAVSGTISNKNTPYTIPAGYHSGLGSVSLDSTSSAALTSENIKSGIQILGVTGSYSGEAVTAGSVSVTPYLTAQTILPSSISKDYISQVNVSAISVTYSDNAAGGRTCTIGTVDPTA